MMWTTGSKVYVLIFVFLFIQNGNGRMTSSETHAILVTCENNLSELLHKHAHDNFVVECPPCRVSACYVYGTAFYSPRSGLCCSGIHDGKNNNNGSVMTVNVHRGGRRKSFEGSVRRGVRSYSSHRSSRLYFTLASLTVTTFPSPTTEQVSTIENVASMITTDSTRPAQPTQTTKSAQTTESTQKTLSTSAVRSTLSDTSRAQMLKSTQAKALKSSTTLRIFSTTAKSPHALKINNAMSTTTTTTTTQTETRRISPSVNHIKLNPAHAMQTITFMNSKRRGNNSIGSATTTGNFLNEQISEKKQNNALHGDGLTAPEVVYILVGVVVAVAFVMIALALARRINRTSWLCSNLLRPVSNVFFSQRNRCRRRTQVNDCVCYVAMDTSIQGLLNDPETCQRPCQVRELLQKDELDLGCSNRVDQDCSDCTKEKCGLPSTFDF